LCGELLLLWRRMPDNNPERGQQMSYAIVLVFEGVSEADYWKVNDILGINRDGTGDWPEGMKSHAAGPTPSGWMVVEKWESKAGAAIAAAGLPAPAQIIDTDTVQDHHID
jgi:hypothetical protein